MCALLILLLVSTGLSGLSAQDISMSRSAKDISTSLSAQDISTGLSAQDISTPADTLVSESHSHEHHHGENALISSIMDEMSTGSISRDDAFLEIARLVFGSEGDRGEVVRRFGDDDVRRQIEESKTQDGAFLDLYHESHTVRCFTPYLIEFRDVIDRGGEYLAEINDLITMKSEIASEEYISPSGKFRMVYDISGTHAVPLADESGSGVPDYVETAAHYADSTWNYMVGTLGFVDPVLPESLYEIQFRSMGAYGSTHSSGTTTYIRVHNNFNGFPPNLDPDGHQMGALKVTIAHEIQHAIQYATNRWRGQAGSFNWVEMDATMVEEMVFPTVKDYLNYLSSSTSVFRGAHNGIPRAYQQASFSIYFLEKFGPEFWVDVWEEVRKDAFIPMFEAIRIALEHRNADLEEEFIENLMWHLASGSRSRPGYGFQSGNLYPSAMISHSGSGVLPYASPFMTFRNHSARFYEITPSINAIQNMAIGLLRDHPGLGVGVIGFDHNATVYTTIINDDSRSDFYGLFTDWPWGSIEKVGIVIANTSVNAGNAQMVVSSDDASSFYKYGDVNRDKKINSADAEYILNNVVNTPGSTANGLSSFLDKGISDVSGDGSVTLYDAALIFSKSSGSIDVFPSDPNGNGYYPQADWFRTATETDIPMAASRAIITNESDIYADYYTSSSPDDDTLRVVLHLLHRSNYSSVFLEVVLDTSLVALDRVIIPGLSNNDQITRFFTSRTGVRVGAIGRTSDISDSIIEMLFVPKKDTTVYIGFPLIQLDESYTNTTTESIEVAVKPKEGVGIDYPGFGDYPATVALLANYPNPFNPTTTIPFELDSHYFVEIDILDVTGRLVSRLAQENYASGRHSLTFNGDGLASGVYLVRMQAIDRSLNTTSHQLIRKITLIK